MGKCVDVGAQYGDIIAASEHDAVPLHWGTATAAAHKRWLTSRSESHAIVTVLSYVITSNCVYSPCPKNVTDVRH